MTRSHSAWLWLALACFAGGPVMLAPAPAFADEGDAGGGDDDEDDSWTSTHLNLRLGIYHRPEMRMNFQFSGLPAVLGGGGPVVVPGTDLNLQRDLGVTENAQSDYMFENGILEAEISFDTRFLSVGVWGILPYYYEGETNSQIDFNFAGETFSAGTFTKSRFEQWHAGLDIKINVLDNEWVRISPVASVKVLAIDWEIEQGVFAGGGGGGGGGISIRADTSDISSLVKIDDDQALPYVEIGGEIRLGYRKFIEADLKVTGLYVTYNAYRASTFQVDLGVTGYLPLGVLDVGLRLGYRFSQYDFKSSDEVTEEDFFDFDLEYSGFNFSAVVRF